MRNASDDMTRRAVIAAGGGLGLGLGLAAPGLAAGKAETAESVTYGAPGDPSIPTVKLRWAFSASVLFADRFEIKSPILRGFTSAGSGKVWGPRLQGRVLPHSGADYYKSGFNTFYILEATDGSRIFIHNRGSKRKFEAQPPPGSDPVPASNPDPNAPGGWVRFRTTPTFTAPVGPHAWMNSTVFLANATKHANPDHTVFTYYEVL